MSDNVFAIAPSLCINTLMHYETFLSFARNLALRSIKIEAFSEMLPCKRSLDIEGNFFKISFYLRQRVLFGTMARRLERLHKTIGFLVKDSFKGIIVFMLLIRFSLYVIQRPFFFTSGLSLWLQQPKNGFEYSSLTFWLTLQLSSIRKTTQLSEPQARLLK